VAVHLELIPARVLNNALSPIKTRVCRVKHDNTTKQDREHTSLNGEPREYNNS
jgi:hypothetical protein